MQARVAPTSPAAKPKSEAMSKVWQEGQLLQPPRTPWGRLVILALIVSLMATAGGLLTLGWYIHRYPNSWVAGVIPLTTTSTTTVVQQIPTKDVTTIPPDVAPKQSIAYGLAQNQGQDGLYTDSQVTGYAWPLSSNGWLLTIDGSTPADAKSLAVLPSAGASQPVVSTITDPVSPFRFLKTSDLNVPPVAFAPSDELHSGQRVWVVTSAAAFGRQLNQPSQPTWTSSDRLETTWSLDVAVDAPAGSAVVDANGRLLGLLGNEHRLWPVINLAEAIKQVLATSAITRPVLGLRTLDRAAAVTSGQASLAGLLIGAADGQTAVTPKSPADRAGLKSGDIITAINGQPASGNLINTLSLLQAGDKLTMNYQRQGKELTALIILGSAHS